MARAVAKPLQTRHPERGPPSLHGLRRFSLMLTREADTIELEGSSGETEAVFRRNLPSNIFHGRLFELHNMPALRAYQVVMITFHPHIVILRFFTEASC